MLPVVVLKFGSSVLATAEDLPLAVDEVYRRLREGSRVLAVVSAFAGDTDRLLGRAREVLGETAAAPAVAAFVATGELQSAALLAGALLRSGVAARIVDPREIDFRVGGGALEADPVSVDLAALRSLWEAHATLVLPGFFGIDPEGRIALLGRGGSDLSALFIAGALGAECHLVKDVPGVFDRDPAVDRSGARRYAVIPWHEASEVAGPPDSAKGLGVGRALPDAVRRQPPRTARSRLASRRCRRPPGALPKRLPFPCAWHFSAVGRWAAVFLSDSRPTRIDSRCSLS